VCLTRMSIISDVKNNSKTWAGSSISTFRNDEGSVENALCGENRNCMGWKLVWCESLVRVSCSGSELSGLSTHGFDACFEFCMFYPLA